MDFVIHKLLKDVNGPVTEKYRASLIRPTKDEISFVNDVTLLFLRHRSGRIYGNFEPDTKEFPFSRLLEECQSSEDFLTFSQVEFFGTVRYGPAQPCEPGNPNSIQVECPIQERVERLVQTIITDSAIMAYVLVASEGDTLGTNPPSSDVYNSYLSSNGIYIHSKFSAFFGMYPPGSQTLKYVIGSANLNTRSLGNLVNQPSEATDSESAIFWTPANDKYWREIMIEHMGALDPRASPMSAIDEFGLIGQRNLELIRRGGKPSPNKRVVRLDVIARCRNLWRACP